MQGKGVQQDLQVFNKLGESWSFLTKGVSPWKKKLRFVSPYKPIGSARIKTFSIKGKEKVY